MTTGILSKRQKLDQRAKTAEFPQRFFDTLEFSADSQIYVNES